MGLKKFAANAIATVGVLLIISLPVMLYVQLWLTEDDRVIPTGFINMMFGLCLFVGGMTWRDEIEKRERRETRDRR